jgi:hypothetical protein
MLARRDAERGPLAWPLKLGLDNAPGADPARQTRFDHRAPEARSQEREREGVGTVFGAALTISALVDRRSAENLIQPSAPKRNRAQQHGSRSRRPWAMC